MQVRDYLNIPYILLAQPVESEDGDWKRRLSFPELGDFYAEGTDVEEVFLAVERLRITEILRRIKAGELPPVPRAPLETADPAWWAKFLGIGDEVTKHLDKSAEAFQRD